MGALVGPDGLQIQDLIRVGVGFIWAKLQIDLGLVLGLLGAGLGLI